MGEMDGRGGDGLCPMLVLSVAKRRPSAFQTMYFNMYFNMYMYMSTYVDLGVKRLEMRRGFKLEAGE
jgi:hypothetical protein